MPERFHHPLLEPSSCPIGGSIRTPSAPALTPLRISLATKSFCGGTSDGCAGSLALYSPKCLERLSEKSLGGSPRSVSVAPKVAKWGLVGPVLTACGGQGGGLSEFSDSLRI